MRNNISGLRLHSLRDGATATFLAFLLIELTAGVVRANVYPTNVRLNGSSSNVVAGANLTISYRLNEAASAGVTIAINSNITTLRTISLAGGGPGTARGTNSVVWDGKDNSSNNVAPGNYSVHVTAAADGHPDWTQISNDGEEGNYVYWPVGIAVNRNTNSPYYGRVFVANAIENPGGVFLPGDGVGILKANADGSTTAEGTFSTGGWNWAGDEYSPWKLEVSEDDYTYINDWTGNGIILRFDQTIATNSLALVLRDDNWPDAGAADLTGPAIVGGGTNTQIWMADKRPDGVGIRRFKVSANGSVATNDLGTTIVPVGGASHLTYYPRDIAIDCSNRIYTIQYETNAASAMYRVFRFPAYVEGGPLVTNADWRIGSNDDDMRGAYGIAVDPTATYVAVAFAGAGSGFSLTSGGVRVFNAANGAAVTTLTPAPFHEHYDVAWDNVGNLYTCDKWDSVWRAYSPPGANQATTVALANVLVPARPTLSDSVLAGGQFQFTLNGQANVSYAIESSTNLSNWNRVTTNTSVNAVRSLSVPAAGPPGFYRAVVVP